MSESRRPDGPERGPAPGPGGAIQATAATWAGAWRQVLANPRGLWTQVGFMVANDVVWLVFWMLFFRRVGEVRGWRIDQIVILFALLTTAAGLVLGTLANIRHLGWLAADGELDAALALPTPTLAHLLVRRVDVLFVGDLVFGVILFAALGQPTLARTALFVFGVVCGSATLLGFLLLVNSASFWFGRNEGGELGFQALVLLANYPVDVFTGAAKLFLYGVVPAAFVSSVPSRLVGEPDLGWALATAGVGVGLLGLGVVVFNRGLRQYTSGATWVGT